MGLGPSTQLPSKATITFYPLLLLVLAPSPTLLSVPLSGTLTSPHLRLSILSLARLTWGVAGLCK